MKEVEAASSELRERSNDLAIFFGEREQDATHIINCLCTFSAMMKDCTTRLKKAN